MVYVSKLSDCPTCGTKPVKMEFAFRKDKKRREYSFICCENNPGHSKTLDDAAKAWDDYCANKVEG